MVIIELLKTNSRDRFWTESSVVVFVYTVDLVGDIIFFGKENTF